MAQGMSNSAACREVGINRKTGNRWRYGRKVVDRAGNVRVYLPITEVRESDAVSERFLSEDERIVIADLCGPRSPCAFARELGRDPATISREVRRNRDPRTGMHHPFQGRVGAAGDIAAVESFFALLQKNVLDCRTWATCQELRIVTWIERTYHRRQKRLARLTPAGYQTVMAPPAALAA